MCFFSRDTWPGLTLGLTRVIVVRPFRRSPQFDRSERSTHHCSSVQDTTSGQYHSYDISSLRRARSLYCDGMLSSICPRFYGMGNPNITDRRLVFCPTLAELPVSCLIVECDDCGRYFAACCLHSSFGAELCREERTTCHHVQLVFVDGACSNNGQENARSGLGITVGYGNDMSWSIPVDEEMDPQGARTNQRAELLAASEGLRKLREIDVNKESHVKSDDDSTYILVTDSEYVVKGITEWFPRWKRRNWRTADGKRPTNLDLFLKLDEYTTSLEEKHVSVGFWQVPRIHNHEADRLAKRAAAENALI